MHWPGIEPGPPAWQARILPLNHQCLMSEHDQQSNFGLFKSLKTPLFILIQNFTKLI